MGKDRWVRGRPEGRSRGGFGRGAFGRGGFGRGGPRGGRGRGFGGNRDGRDRFSSNQWQRTKKETPGKRLSEEEIGATEYMSEHKGFNGIIKSRYSDFQVSEINNQGDIAKLTTSAPPAPLKEEPVKEDEELLLSKYNVEILPMETWDEINRLAMGLGSPDDKVEIDVTTATKEERTKIHEAVKKAFKESIVGSTVNNEDKKFVRFIKYRKGVRIDNRVKWEWPAEYVYFVVHKHNCDTMEAARRIADRLQMHIKPQMLGYAGTKDRRAKTSQWFSVKKVDPRKIASACKDLRDVYVGDYSFRQENLKLGMLKGNKFRIALRNVTAPEETISAACEQLRDRGFINYYGLQRFGSRVDVPTYDIGMKLLQGNIKEAIDAILSECEGPLQEALHIYKEEGAAQALRAIPKYLSTQSEAKVLHALAQRPKELHTAMYSVPRNTRLLYLHSYQSLVWNRCASERLRRRGLAPAVGDLVALADVPIKEETEDEESDSEENQDEEDGMETQETTEETVSIKKEVTTDPTVSLENTNKQKQPEEKKIIPVKVLTQEDLDSNKYTIFDVIMPLPGYNIEYPPNIRDHYEMLLEKDGLTTELRNKNKSYSMSGAYRHIAVRPSDVSWRCVRYTDPYADLIASDADEMQGKKLTGIVDDGVFTALLLTLTLPSSCYCTMALRELLKADTSSDKQAEQNNYHKRKRTPSQGDDDGKRMKEDE